MRETITRFICDLCKDAEENPMVSIDLGVPKHVCDCCLRKIVAAWKRLGSIEHEKRRLT